MPIHSSSPAMVVQPTANAGANNPTTPADNDETVYYTAVKETLQAELQSNNETLEEYQAPSFGMTPNMEGNWAALDASGDVYPYSAQFFSAEDPSLSLGPSQATTAEQNGDLRPTDILHPDFDMNQFFTN